MSLSQTTVRRAPAAKLGARPSVVLLAVTAALVLVVLLSLAFGSRPVAATEVIGGILDWLRGVSSTDIGSLAVQRRIPRTVLGVIAGAALGLSGALMQAITRNPLADPGILGVNTGAALFVVTGSAFFAIATPGGYLGLALVGAVLTALLVYFIGSVGPGGSTPIKLALAGAAVSAALASLTAAILLPRQAALNDFRFWQVGNVARADWVAIGTIAPVILVGGLIALLSANSLNALLLGDDVATGLGVPVLRVRILAAAAGVALCAAVTAVAGPIGFVGLMVPHAMRLLVGSNQRWLLPLSALAGAILLTAADTIGRVIGNPGEVEAGVVTSFLGGPVLVAIARRTRLRGL